MKKGFDKGLISFKKGMGKVGTSISNGWNVFSSKTKKLAIDSKKFIQRKTGSMISNPRRPVEENNENFSEARPRSSQNRERSESLDLQSEGYQKGQRVQKKEESEKDPYSRTMAEYAPQQDFDYHDKLKTTKENAETQAEKDSEEEEVNFI